MTRRYFLGRYRLSGAYARLAADSRSVTAWRLAARNIFDLLRISTYGAAQGEHFRYRYKIDDMKMDLVHTPYQRTCLSQLKMFSNRIC